MKVLEIVFLGLGISMDAFAVSLCKGLSCGDSCKKTAFVCALWFSIFQIVFPLLGFSLGLAFASLIDKFDHYIIFVIFLALGINLIVEGAKKSEKQVSDDLSFKSMFLLSFATSVDSLAVGITFALMNFNIVLCTAIIVILTFALTLLGVFVGHKFGKKYKKQSAIIGGIVLIFVGTEILLQHLFL